MRDDNYSMLEARMNRLCEEVQEEFERTGQEHYKPSTATLYLVGSQCVCDWRWNGVPGGDLEIRIGELPYSEQATRLEECVRGALKVLPAVLYA